MSEVEDLPDGARSVEAAALHRLPKLVMAGRQLEDLPEGAAGFLRLPTWKTSPAECAPARRTDYLRRSPDDTPMLRCLGA